MCRGYRCAETIYSVLKLYSGVQRLYIGVLKLYTGVQRLQVFRDYIQVRRDYIQVRRDYIQITSVHAGAEARGSSLTQSQTITCLVRKSNWCLAAAETVVRGRGASTARVHYLYITCHRYFTCQQRQPGLAFCTSAAAASVNLVSLKAAVRWLCCNRKRFVYLSRWI